MADLIGAVSLEGFDGRKEPFTDLIHLVRPHKGQVTTAARMLDFLEGSEIITQPKNMYRTLILSVVFLKCMAQLKILLILLKSFLQQKSIR